MGVNSGLIPIVIVFLKSGTLILAHFCIIIIGVQEYHITTKHHSTPSCLRHAFVVPSLWLPLESELMMDAEGHHQGGRAELKLLTRRDGVSNPLNVLE